MRAITFLIFFNFISGKAQEYLRSNRINLDNSSNLQYIGQFNRLLYFISDRQYSEDYRILKFDFDSLRLVSSVDFELVSETEYIKKCNLDGNVFEVTTLGFHGKEDSTERVYQYDCETMNLLREEEWMRPDSLTRAGFRLYPDFESYYSEADKRMEHYFQESYSKKHNDISKISGLKKISNAQKKLILIDINKNKDPYLEMATELDSVSNMYFLRLHFDPLKFPGYAKDERMVKLDDGKFILDYQFNEFDSLQYRLIGKYYNSSTKEYGFFVRVYSKDIRHITFTHYKVFMNSKDLQSSDSIQLIEEFLTDLGRYAYVENENGDLFMVFQNSGVIYNYRNYKIYLPNYVNMKESDLALEHFSFGKKIQLLYFSHNGDITFNTIPLFQLSMFEVNAIGYNLYRSGNFLDIYFYDNRLNESVVRNKELNPCFMDKNANLYKVRVDYSTGKIIEKFLVLYNKQFVGFFPMISGLIIPENRVFIHVVKSESNGFYIEKITY